MKKVVLILLLLFVFPALSPVISGAAKKSASTGALTAELFYSPSEQIATLACDNKDNIFLATVSGKILKITSGKKTQKICSGLKKGDESKRTFAILPNGDLLTNDYIHGQDTLIRIDQTGHKTVLTSFKDKLTALATDTGGRIFLGFWSSQGKLTINPKQYLEEAENISGRVMEYSVDGNLNPLYEGGLPLALTACGDGRLYAGIWGDQGSFTPTIADYPVYDKQHAFFKLISTRSIIKPISADQESKDVLITDQLHAVSAIAVSKSDSLKVDGISAKNELLFAYGVSKDGKSGLYRIKEHGTPVKIRFVNEKIDQNISSLTSSDQYLYFTTESGKVYRVALQSIHASELLTEAALNMSPNEINTLLTAGADINITGKSDWTPLMYALSNQKTENAKLLIKKGANINTSDNEGMTPLMSALCNNQAEIVKLLIDKDADINARSKDNSTPLMFALEYSQTEHSRLLIAKGADINARDNDNWTPVLIALRYGQPEIAKLLIELGADIDAGMNNWTALMMALSYGQSENAKLLIDKGADINAQNNGVTPLMVALKNKQPENAKYLIEKGADINATDQNKASVLMYAICYSNPELVKLIIEKGADINARDNRNTTALMYALYNFQNTNAELLIQKGADLNTKDRNGLTPLIYALANYELEIAKALIATGIALDAQDQNHRTPLMFALINNEQEQAALLIQKGADLNVKDNNNLTALILALNYDRPEIAKLLVEKGADINVADQNGNTPSIIAQKKGFKEVLDAINSR